jgi:mono/diheme cytochrome c family protein
LKQGLFIAISLVFAFTSGCAAHAGANTPGTTAITNPSASNAVVTAGKLAALGAGDYRVYCSGCHGLRAEGGSGDTLIGPGISLSDYSSVAGLLFFNRTRMPYENPGSLTMAQYNQITAFLALQNGAVSPDTTWENLESILIQS